MGISLEDGTSASLGPSLGPETPPRRLPAPITDRRFAPVATGGREPALHEENRP